MKEKTTSGAGRKIRVLIVDDSDNIRSMLVRLCAGLPKLEVVGEAKDGLEALEAIQKLKPDVVTLDIRMPKLNGLQVLKSLREGESKPIIIMLTGVTEEIYRQKCFEFGAKHVFAKGTELDEIVRVLRAL